MKGYIVGYLEEWANDLNPVIVGYYTTWDNALEAIKKTERINIDQFQRFCKVYLVELEADKTQQPNSEKKIWVENYDHYYVTTDDKTILQSNTGKIIEIELPEPAPKPAPEPAPEPAQEPAPEPAPKPAPEPAQEPAPKPAPEPAQEPAPEPAPKPEYGWQQVQNSRARSKNRRYIPRGQPKKRLAKPYSQTRKDT